MDLWEGWNLSNDSVIKWQEVAKTFVVVDYRDYFNLDFEKYRKEVL